MALTPPAITDEMLQPFREFEKAVLEFGELVAARFQIIFEELVPTITAVYDAIWQEYRQAGMPYGESEEGLGRWLKEMAEIQRLQREAEYLWMRHQMLADFRQVIYGRGVVSDFKDFSRGQRVRLKADYTNGWGITYKAGQTGRVLLSTTLSDRLSIEFDGYEEERQMAQKLKEEKGEGPSIVSYLSSIPVEIIEVI